MKAKDVAKKMAGSVKNNGGMPFKQASSGDMSRGGGMKYEQKGSKPSFSSVYKQNGGK